MARKVVEGNAIDGIFTQERKNITETTNVPIKTNNVGRPKGKDIKKETELVKRGFYITPELDEQIGITAIKNKMDKSEMIRLILNEYFNQ